MLFEDVKARIPLIAVVERELGAPVKSSGGWQFWLCPFHSEKTPSFGVKGNSYRCWGCGSSGSVIDFVAKRRNITPVEAARELAQTAGIDSAPGIPPVKRIKAPEGVRIDAELPTADWSSAAAIAVDTCATQIWHTDAAKARQWLARRGIDGGLIERFQLGFSFGGELSGLYLERGITIPHIAGGQVYAINVRRAVTSGTKNKYLHVAGGKPGAHLFNGDALAGADEAWITEGELDTIALQGVIGAAAAVTLGSKTAKITSAGLAQILPVQAFFIATDAGEDEAAADYWLSMVGRRGVRVLPPGGVKDVCAAFEAGCDLRQWVIDCQRGW